jgi:hypothetical protein
MGLCGSAEACPAKDPARDWDEGVPVYLNVYDLQGRPTESGKGGASLNSAMGFGAYHSGVQVFNYEFSFGGDPSGDTGPGTGVFTVNPKSALPAAQFHRQHLIGHLPKGTTQNQVMNVIMRLKNEWPKSSYHIVKRNCNHFSQALIEALDEEFFIKPSSFAQQQADLREAEAENGVPVTSASCLPTGGAKKSRAVAKRRFAMPAYVNRAARLGAVLAPEAFVRALTKSAPPAQDTVPQGGPGAGGASTPPPPRRAPTPASPQTQNESRARHPLPATRAELEKMSARELKTAMHVHGVDWTGCVEKPDFIDAVMKHHEAAKRRF